MFFFLTYLILCNRLLFSSTSLELIQMRSFFFKCVLFNNRVIFHCVYTQHLSYSFFCRWISSLLPCPSYCKQCCSEHWGTLHVSLSILVSSVCMPSSGIASPRHYWICFWLLGIVYSTKEAWLDHETHCIATHRLVMWSFQALNFSLVFW